MRTVSRSLLALCLFLGACGEDEPPPPVPPGKVTLRVSALIPVGTPAWYEGRDEPAVITFGCDRTLGIGLTIEHYSLRAPNACNGALQCGYNQVTILRAGDGSVAVGPTQSASTAPALDLSLLEPLVGDYLVRPELLNTDGTPFTQNFLEPPTDLPVTIASASEDCEPAAGGAGGAGSETPEEAGGSAGVTGE